MRTQSKEKITKAKRLAKLIEDRKAIEKEEAELKKYFKGEIEGGVLEAGDVVITIEVKSRESLDREALEAELGSKLKKYIKVTEYEQVNVKEVA